MKTEAQVARILNQQTGIAKHVYEAVPIGGQWTTQQIYTEMKRLNHAIDIRRLEGCLSSLVDSKLIKMNKGFYQRCPVRATVTLKTSKPKEEPMATTTKRVPREPTAIAVDLCAEMTMLTKQMTSLCERFELAALEIQEYIEQAQAKSKVEENDLKELKRLMDKYGK